MKIKIIGGFIATLLLWVLLSGCSTAKVGPATTKVEGKGPVTFKETRTIIADGKTNTTILDRVESKESADTRVAIAELNGNKEVLVENAKAKAARNQTVVIPTPVPNYGSYPTYGFSQPVVVATSSFGLGTYTTPAYPTYTYGGGGCSSQATDYLYYQNCGGGGYAGGTPIGSYRGGTRPY